MDMFRKRGDRLLQFPLLQFPRSGFAALTAGALFLHFAAPQPAAAQDSWVNPDVYELRDEVKKLAQEIAALRADGLGAAPSGGADAPAVSGDAYVRLDRLDAQVRNLTGAVEELDQRTRADAKRRAAKLAELDFRIARIEEGKTGKHTGKFPGAQTLDGNDLSADGVSGGGRLQPLQPENRGAGAPPTVLGNIRGQNPDDAVVARPIYDRPPNGGAASSGTASSGSGKSLFDSAIASLQAGDWEAAEDRFQSFIRENGSDARAPDARYFLGETYRIRGRFHDAVRTYAAGLKSHPRSKRAPDSWMRLGESLAQINQVGKACEAFKQVSLRFPDAPAKLLREAKKQSTRAGCG